MSNLTTNERTTNERTTNERTTNERTTEAINEQSVILVTATRYLLPLLLLFSLFLLLRGHNLPGGGFVGGLVAAAAIALYALATNVDEAQRVLRLDLRTLMGLGLLCAVVAGLIGLIAGLPFLTGVWYPQPFPVVGKVGTPLLFDVGVYLAVIGVTLQILFVLMATTVGPQPGSSAGTERRAAEGRR